MAMGGIFMVVELFMYTWGGVSLHLHDYGLCVGCLVANIMYMLEGVFLCTFPGANFMVVGLVIISLWLSWHIW